jgi:hypothetical protein
LRRVLLLSVLAVALPAATIVAPVVTAPAPSASPHPVASHDYEVPLPDAAITTDPAAQSGGDPAPAVAALAAPATAPTSTPSFRMVGVSWSYDPAITDVTAQVRVRTNGQWTAWQSLGIDDLTAKGPLAASAAAEHPAVEGTSPLWVGKSDGVQARIVDYAGARPRNARVNLIDPGTSTADATVGKAHTPASVAVAAVPQPQILSRADWGADESLREQACPDAPYYTSTPKVAFVHHTVTGNGYAAADVPAIIRSIYAYHVQGEGWCDIGYNFLVDAYGRIWEGRAGGIDKAVLGAHTGGFNTASFGVSMIGTYDSLTPPAALQHALAQLLAWKLSISYDNPLGTATLTAAPFSGSRYPTGATETFNVISGHRDADLTACPGNAGYAILPSLRQAVAQLMPSGLVQPTVTVAQPAGGVPGTAHVTAGMIAPGDWQLTVQDSGGATLATASGTGSSVDATWQMTQNGSPVRAGVYTVSLTSTQGGVAAVPWSSTVLVGGPFTRLSGADRYATAVAVGETAAPAATTVVIANGQAAADTVAAGPLAYHLSAPLLLTQAGALPASVAADITARGATTAYIVGGPAVVSATVETQLKAAGITTIVRYGGADRFATAAQVAMQIGAQGGHAFVVEGVRGLVDGFTTGGVAGYLGDPVLMATATAIPPATQAALTALGVSSTTVVGGLIPPSVVAQLPGAQQVAGADRYATSAAVATAFAGQLPSGPTVLADGNAAFPADAVAAAALGRPTLLVTPNAIPAPVSAYLPTATGITAIIAVGGTAVIGNNVAAVASGLAGLS